MNKRMDKRMSKITENDEAKFCWEINNKRRCPGCQRKTNGVEEYKSNRSPGKITKTCIKCRENYMRAYQRQFNRSISGKKIPMKKQIEILESTIIGLKEQLSESRGEIKVWYQFAEDLRDRLKEEKLRNTRLRHKLKEIGYKGSTVELGTHHKND